MHIFLINVFLVCEDDDGQTYMQGNSWTTMVNGKLKRCTCGGEGMGAYTCSITMENTFLVVADGHQIHKISLFEGDVYRRDYISNLPGTAVALAIDKSNNAIFWTDVGNGNAGIYKAQLDIGTTNTGTRFVRGDIHEPNGIAIDWLSKNVIWSDAQLGAIFMVDKYGKNRRRLISGLSEPRSIAVDPLVGALFWTDYADGTVNFCAMSGHFDPLKAHHYDQTARFLTLYNYGKWPNQLVLDPQYKNMIDSENYYNGMIYWIDGGKRTIEQIDYIGNNHNILLNFNHMFNMDGNAVPAFGLALHNDDLYFSPWHQTDGTIYSISRDGSSGLTAISRGISPRPFGMAIVFDYMQQKDKGHQGNFCESNRHHCSHLCVNAGSEDGYECTCPSLSGLVIGPDGRNCVTPDEFLLVTSLTEGTVSLIPTKVQGIPVSSNGTEFAERTVVAQSVRPSAVAFDPMEQRIYWSDVALNRIYRQYLNGTFQGIFLEDSIGTVDGIAIDWNNRLLFFRYVNTSLSMSSILN